MKERSSDQKILSDAQVRGKSLGFEGIFLNNFVEREIASKTWPKLGRERGRSRKMKAKRKAITKSAGPAHTPKKPEDYTSIRASSHAVNWKMTMKEYNRQVEAAKRRHAKIGPGAVHTSKMPTRIVVIPPDQCGDASFDPSKF